MGKKRLGEVLRSAERRCAERGARLTERRRAVLELLCRSDKPLSAYEILDRMRARVRNPAPPTVYRALDFLLEQGLVHKLESLHAFIGCSHLDGPHSSQFLICGHCGEVEELASSAVVKSVQSAAEVTGFRTKRPIVELWGTCAECFHTGQEAPPHSGS